MRLALPQPSYCVDFPWWQWACVRVLLTPVLWSRPGDQSESSFPDNGSLLVHSASVNAAARALWGSTVMCFIEIRKARFW